MKMIKLTSVYADKREGVLLINPEVILSIDTNLKDKSDEPEGAFVHLGDNIYHSTKETPGEIEKILQDIGINIY